MEINSGLSQRFDREPACEVKWRRALSSAIHTNP